jgi:uncharacterized membrane protein
MEWSRRELGAFFQSKYDWDLLAAREWRPLYHTVLQRRQHAVPCRTQSAAPARCCSSGGGGGGGAFLNGTSRGIGRRGQQGNGGRLGAHPKRRQRSK